MNIERLTRIDLPRRAVSDLNSFRKTGKHTLWFPANTMTPRTTNPAAVGLVELATNDVMMDTLDYDQTTAENAQVSHNMPISWDEGDLTFKFHWTARGGASGDVIWGVSVLAVGEGDAQDAAFSATINAAADSLTTADDEHVTAETANVTSSGSPSPGDRLIINFLRNAGLGGDTLDADALLLGVEMFFILNGANDS